MAFIKLCCRTSCIITAFFVTFVNANCEEVRPVVNFTATQFGWMYNRIFSVSTSSPVTNQIRSNATLGKMLDATYDYIDTVWDAVARRRNRTNPDPRACNLYNNNPSDWASVMTNNIQIFQIGMIDDTCFSQIDVMNAADENEIPRQTAQSVRQTFADARMAIANAIENIDINIDGNWTKGQMYPMLDRRWKRSGQECYVDSILAHRKEGKWYLRAGATNLPRSVYAVSFGRHFLHEFIPREGDESLKVAIRSIHTGECEPSTTVVTKWEGTGYSVERDSFDDSISPLAQAFQQNMVDVDISLDAITPSNVAILALPMVMNFIPIAFVAHPHITAMFVYIIVTDIFSTIPFLVKGIELIHSSQPRREVVFAYFSGNETTGTMQSWIVDCTGEREFRNIGISFLVIAILALVGGILLEFWAKQYMRKKTQRKHNAVNGPFGTIGLDVGRTRLFGAEGVTGRSRKWWLPRGNGQSSSTNGGAEDTNMDLLS